MEDQKRTEKYFIEKKIKEKSINFVRQYWKKY